MKHSTIIVFTGLPGAGKTTLSRQVASALRLPLIAKDAIKEIMYDNIGWSDRAFSAKLAHATFRIMEYITGQNLKSGYSIILESNYSPKLASKQFQLWQKEYACDIIQIVCQADTDVLARRYVERNSTNRHPGHIDDSNSVEEHQSEFVERIKGREDQPLDVKGAVKIVDTTDFSTVDVEEIVSWIRQQIELQILSSVG